MDWLLTNDRSPGTAGHPVRAKWRHLPQMPMTLDGAAIERLYRSHGHLVLRRARLLLGSEPDAQEALQEVFAALLRAPQDLRRAGSVLGWLYQATTHFCLNQLRNRRTGARILQDRVAPTSGIAG